MLSVLIVLRTLAVAGALVLLVRRMRRETTARATWRHYVTAFALLTGASTLETVVVVGGSRVGSSGLWLALPLRLASTVASFHLYRGVALWMQLREKSRPAGRVDWLVGGELHPRPDRVVNVVVEVPDGVAGLAVQLRWLHVCSFGVLLGALVVAAWRMPRAIRGRPGRWGSRCSSCSAPSCSTSSSDRARTSSWPPGPRGSCSPRPTARCRCCGPSRSCASTPPPSRCPSPAVPSGWCWAWPPSRAPAARRPTHWALGFGTVAIAGSSVRLVRLVRDLADHDRALRQAGPTT